MLKALLFALVFAIGPGAAAAQPARAGQPFAARHLGDDMFAAGGSVTVSQPVAGDLILAGGGADVDAAVAGDVLAVGGKVRLGADVGQSVYAAGGQLTINGKVGRSVRVAGGQVELGPKAEIAGNVSAAGGQVRLAGMVKGYVQATGGRVVIDGPVSGDVIAAAGKMELGPNARVAGKLRYRSSEALLQDPAAQVAGGIEKLSAPLGRGNDDGRSGRGTLRHGIAGVLGLLWTLGLIVGAGALLLALPDFSAAVARTLRERPGTSVLLGFVFLVCVPVAAVILCITLIGIPLGLFSMAFYAALLPLAYASAGIGLGHWALVRWLPERAGSMPMRIAASATVLIVLSLLGWIPGLGTLAGFLALLVGIGALLLQIRRPASTGSL